MSSPRTLAVAELGLQDENSPLLSTDQPTIQEIEKQKSRFSRFGTTIAIYALSFLAASVNLINGLVAPTGAASKEIINREWWKELATKPGTLTHGILNGIAGLAINTIMHIYFFPKAFKGIIEDIKNFRQHPVRASITLVLAIVGAIGSFAVALAAYNWFPEASWGAFFAGGLALINVAAYLATRYVSIKGVLTRQYNALINEEFAAQQHLAQTITHLNNPQFVQSTYSRILHEKLGSCPDDTLVTADQVESITVELAQALQEYMIENPNCLNEPTKLEKIQKGLLMAIDLTLALIEGVPGFGIFMQKGEDGFASFLNLTNVNDWAKRAIGFGPGLSSASVYAMAGYDFRVKTIQYIQFMRENPTPKNITLSLLLLGALGLSTSNMQAITQAIVARKDNLLFVGHNALGTSLIASGIIAGFTINTNSALDQAFQLSALTRKKLERPEQMAAHLDHAGRLISLKPENAGRLSFFKNYQEEDLSTVAINDSKQLRRYVSFQNSNLGASF